MATQYTRRVVIVIPASYQSAANQAADQLDEGDGRFTFTVGLSPSGAEPATHYWASPALTETQYQQVQGMKAALFPDAQIFDWDMDAEPGKPEEVLQGLGLKTIEAAA
jgi:hypothetical protein